MLSQTSLNSLYISTKINACLSYLRGAISLYTLYPDFLDVDADLSLDLLDLSADMLVFSMDLSAELADVIPDCL